MPGVEFQACCYVIFLLSPSTLYFLEDTEDMDDENEMMELDNKLEEGLDKITEDVASASKEERKKQEEEEEEEEKSKRKEEENKKEPEELLHGSLTATELIDLFCKVTNAARL